jgi:hypothetical protein
MLLSGLVLPDVFVTDGNRTKQTRFSLSIPGLLLALPVVRI